MELAPLIRTLWRAGFPTVRSCQEHMTGKVWVEFADAQAATLFLDAVAEPNDVGDSLWRRANAWGFGTFGERSEPLRGGVRPTDAWEYHITVSDDSYDNAAGRVVSKGPNFAMAVSVLFPRSDLTTVVDRLSELLNRDKKRGRK